MRLSDVLRNLASYDEEATIIAAEPWTPDSAASVHVFDTGRVSEMARDGKTYFLEVAIARELRESWTDAQGDERAFCERVIQYAINDA